MTRALKVYTWQGFRNELPGHHRTTIEVVAAANGSAAARAAGFDRTRQLFNFCETGNDEDIKQAMSAPGTVFWRPIDQIPRNRKWTKARGQA
jgi:hypothetical protein